MRRPAVAAIDPLIAIVDDDRSVREGLQRMLQAHGLATAVFASAEQFLAAETLQLASCLIVDVRLSGMSGLALFDRLAAEGCRKPTILITACPTSGEQERAIAAGALAYLAKPCGEHTLLATVRAALLGETRTEN